MPFTIVDGIVDIEPQLLEVGDDDQPSALVLALVAEGLSLDLREVGGLVVLQLYHADDFSLQQDSPVGLFRVGLVLLLCDQVVVGQWIQRLAQHLDEQLAEETLLELLFLTLQYSAVSLSPGNSLCTATMQSRSFLVAARRDTS